MLANEDQLNEAGRMDLCIALRKLDESTSKSKGKAYNKFYNELNQEIRLCHDED